MTYREPVAAALEALGRLGHPARPSGRGWSARCPGHDDHVASLSISEGEDGRALIHCHAGCSVESVTRALELDLKDLFVEAMPSGWETAYTVRDAEGHPQAVHVRVDLLDGTKRFFWRGSDGASGLGGVPVAKLPLFGSERVHEWQEDEPILVVEGEKAASALIEAGFRTLGTVTGAGGCPGSEPLAVLRGREVILWPDNDAPGRDHMAMLARGLRFVAASVRVFEWSGGGDRCDAFDYLRHASGAAERLRADLASTVPAIDWLSPDATAETDEQSEPPDGAELKDETPGTARDKQSTRLIRLAEEAELFHTPGGEAFATVPVNEHFETHAIRSCGFRRWLLHQWYLVFQTAPGSQAITDAISTLEARAQYAATARAVSVRLGEREGMIYLDLANEGWEVVEIGPFGWKVITESPVRFRRPRGMARLPHPVPGGTIDQLRPFVNVEREDDFILYCSFLVAALRPRGPYPLLGQSGEQGSAKSTNSRVARALIDPSEAPVRTEPRSEHDLMIAATNSWIQAYDNLSHMPTWLSDALCRLATGGGLTTRELYSNAEETILDAQRPVVVTGIDEVVNRNDLLDRALMINLPQIPEDRRRTETDFWESFERVRPSVLGALLDAVSVALRVAPGIRLRRLPRMADFAVWAVAASPKLGWGPAAFLNAYAGNRDAAHELALEMSPVSSAIRDLVSLEDEWEGTSTELFEALVGPIALDERRRTRWPGNPRALSGVLRRMAPNLRAIGIEVTFDRKGSRRSIIVRRRAENCVISVTSVTGADSAPGSTPSGIEPVASSAIELRHGASSQALQNARQE